MLPGRARFAVAVILACSRLFCSVPHAAAQTEDDLAAGRKLFAEALKDEQDKRYEAALEKYLTVQRVRDTVNVRFRIGACFEGMGRPAAALQAYEGAIALGQGDNASADAVRAASERAAKIDKTVARLTVVLSAHAPADAAVTIDETPVAREALGTPIALDPGHHSIRARAKDAPDFHTAVTLPEGGRVSIAIPLDPLPPQPQTRPGDPNGAPVRPPDERPSEPRTAAFVALGGGALLLGGAAVTFALRHGDISTLNSACPNGVCPTGSNESDLESTRKRALFEGPLAVGLGVAGIVAAGTGVYLLLRPHDTVTVAPVVSHDGGALNFGGRF